MSLSGNVDVHGRGQDDKTFLKNDDRESRSSIKEPDVSVVSPSLIIAK